MTGSNASPVQEAPTGPRLLGLPVTGWAVYGAAGDAIVARPPRMNSFRLYKREPVVEAHWRYGERLLVGIPKAVAACGFKRFFVLVGRPCCPVFVTRGGEGEACEAVRALRLQGTIKPGIVAPNVKPTPALPLTQFPEARYIRPHGQRSTRSVPRIDTWKGSGPSVTGIANAPLLQDARDELERTDRRRAP